MPRFYFHVRNGPDIYEDHDGIDLPGSWAAYAEALRLATELLGDVPEFGPDTIIEIADETGQTVLTVPFSEAIGPTH